MIQDVFTALDVYCADPAHLMTAGQGPDDLDYLDHDLYRDLCHVSDIYRNLYNLSGLYRDLSDPSDLSDLSDLRDLCNTGAVNEDRSIPH